eukprot:3940971-Rhodomonas_salina.2
MIQYNRCNRSYDRIGGSCTPIIRKACFYDRSYWGPCRNPPTWVPNAPPGCGSMRHTWLHIRECCVMFLAGDISGLWARAVLLQREWTKEVLEELGVQTDTSGSGLHGQALQLSPLMLDRAAALAAANAGNLAKAHTALT